MNLTTTYLGLKLRTPLVPSASPLSLELDNVKKMEDAGAAAVVFHSLFEEQIGRECGVSASNSRTDPDTYLEHIASAKRCVSIPIIASLNCSKLDNWVSFARQIQQAGADALELNIYQIPTDMELSGSVVEQDCIEIVKWVRAAITIPLAVKLSPFFSNFANMAGRFDAAGAGSLVLFNRFYQPDIDLEKIDVTPNVTLSSPIDMRLPLRWIGILYGRVRANLAGTSGIHRSSDVIKMMMAGADVTMLCTILLRHGIDHIRTIEKDIVAFMEHHQYASLNEIKGVLSQKNCADPGKYERAQYVHALSTYKPPS